MVFVLISVFVLGPLTITLSLAEYFNANSTRRFWRNILLIKAHYGLAGVFEENPYHAVNGSLWTLCYEFRIYFIAPLILVIFSYQKKIFHSAFIALASVFYIFEFFYPSPTYSPLHHYLKFSYLFAYGAWFNLERYSLLQDSRWQWLAIATLIFALGTSFFLPIYFALFPALIISQGLRKKSLLDKRLLSLGDLSYGIYLYSFPLQQLFYAWVKEYATPWNMFFTCLLPLIAIAALSYKLVESPCLALKRRSTRQVV